MFGRTKHEKEERRSFKPADDAGKDLFSDAEQYDQRGGFNNQNFYAQDFRPQLIEEETPDYPATPDNRWNYDRGAGRRSSSDYSYEGTRGSNVGKGPKGYQRSDGRIQEEICELLTHDSRLDATDVEVQVKDGSVVLQGTVGTREDKWRAEEHAEECFGVKDVRNELRVTDKNRSELPWNEEWNRQLRNTRFPLYPFD